MIMRWGIFKEFFFLAKCPLSGADPISSLLKIGTFVQQFGSSSLECFSLRKLLNGKLA
jgi:hypothetical protein